MPKKQKPMTVVHLKVDGYQRMIAADVTPALTGAIEIRGRNGQGKSSLIEAMAEALGVVKSDLPITEGEHAAEVEVDLGDLIVLKKWTRDSGGQAKAALTVKGRDGSKLKSPAAVLKELRGNFADPVAFLEMKAPEQVKTVLGVTGLDEELERLEGIVLGNYDDRRDLGRDLDRSAKALDVLRLEVEGLPSPPITGTAE